MHYKELEKLALGSGFAHAVPLDTTTISLKQEVRDMCKNGCPAICQTMELSSGMWFS